MLINKITERWIEAFINNPKSCVLIDDHDGTEQAINIAELLYERLIHGNMPLIRVELASEKHIGIDAIRSLQKSLHQIADRADGISRIAMINPAEKLTDEAQNSLLKLLEELPQRTLVILVGNKEKLLKTIVSRCFIIPVLPIEREAVLEYTTKLQLPKAQVEKAYLLSEGSWSKFSRYLTEPGIEDLEEQIKEAKEFLVSSPFERQLLIKKILKDPEQTQRLLDTLQLVSKSAMRNAANIHQKQSWKNRLKLLLHAKTLLEKNVSARLVLLDLSLNL